MSEYKLLINGKLEPGDGEIDILNPATEEVIARSPVASKSQLENAVTAAEGSFQSWSKTTIARRRECLQDIAVVVEENAELLGNILTQEQGKPLEQAVFEIKRFAQFTRTFADMSLESAIVEDSAERHVEIHRFPLGVVAAILPWNFPLLLLGFKLGPALITGNTLVIKPAPTTPLTTLKIAELIQDLVPSGVVNVIADDNSLGEQLTSHPRIRKIAFTGSTETGIKVMTSAASTLKRLTLELGGNDAALVLNDVNPSDIAHKIFNAAFGNNGQVCLAIKRLYVHENIHDELCDELVSIANTKIVGNGCDADVDLGPLQNKTQYKKLISLLDDTRSNSRIIAGGHVLQRKGYFIEPTIVCDIKPNSRIIEEEQFGPILPIIKYSDIELAIEEINKSNFGLGASVWSCDLGRARNYALMIDAGTVWINKHPEIDPLIPLSGAKLSGLGVELGVEGLHEFTQRRVVNIAR